MKVVILYRLSSEHARAVETFIHDFKRLHPNTKVEPINLDSRDGIAMAALYDITRFPAILSIATNGMLIKHWEGETLPLMDEVAAHTYSPT